MLENLNPTTTTAIIGGGVVFFAFARQLEFELKVNYQEIILTLRRRKSKATSNRIENSSLISALLDQDLNQTLDQEETYTPLKPPTPHTKRRPVHNSKKKPRGKPIGKPRA